MDWNFDEIIDRRGTNCVKCDLNKAIFGREDIIPLWVADMDFLTPKFITEKLRERTQHSIFSYSFRDNEFYQSIIDWVERRHNWKIKKEWICFSPGIVPALNFSTLSYTDINDSIIIQTPVYPPFYTSVQNHNRRLVCNELVQRDGRWEMDFDALEKQIDSTTKMIVLCNPHNPVGRAWTKEELQTFAEICINNDLTIVSDDIHCDLTLPGNTYIPLASINEEIAQRTVTCIAPSKTFNVAGLATSAIIIPDEERRNAFLKTIQDLHIENGNIFGTIASTEAFKHGDEWLDALMQYIDDNAKYVCSFLNERIPEIIPSKLEATFLMWLDCRKLGMKGKALKDFFVWKAGVGLNEGSEFGQNGEGFMRLNIATPRAVLQQALLNIEKAIKQIRQ